MRNRNMFDLTKLKTDLEFYFGIFIQIFSASTNQLSQHWSQHLCDAICQSLKKLPKPNPLNSARNSTLSHFQGP